MSNAGICRSMLVASGVKTSEHKRNDENAMACRSGAISMLRELIAHLRLKVLQRQAVRVDVSYSQTQIVSTKSLAT